MSKTQLVSRLTATSATPVREEFDPVKLLSKENRKDFLAMCQFVLDLNIGSTYNNAARTLLRKGGYESAKEALFDVRLIVKYFGGDCSKNVGAKILQEISDGFRN
jgi:hypothetical protein